MGTKNNPGAWDCYAAAHPDEPMFVLLGRDPSACVLVALWAHVRELAGEDPAKVREARQCASQLARWAIEAGKKEKIVQAAHRTWGGWYTYTFLRGILDIDWSSKYSGPDATIVKPPSTPGMAT